MSFVYFFPYGLWDKYIENGKYVTLQKSLKSYRYLL